MPKFMYLTDAHIQAATPARRTGNFENDILAKLIWILIEAQALKCDAVVCGGDLFDHSRPSYRLAVEVLRMIRNAGLPWYHVLGNHELVGHNPDSYKRGVLAFFEQAPEFEILNDLEFGGYVLRAVHYRHGVEELIDWPVLGDAPEIVIAHAMIVPTPRPYEFVLPRQINTTARLVLTGHSHDPFGAVVSRENDDAENRKQVGAGLGMILNDPVESHIIIPEGWDATTFVNPGSLGRVAFLAHNLGRIPRALIIDTGPPLTVTALPVAVARPASEAFDAGAAEAAGAWNNRIADFLDAMDGVRVEGIKASSIVIEAAKARAEVERIEDIPADQRVVLDHALEVVAEIESMEDGGE